MAGITTLDGAIDDAVTAFFFQDTVAVSIKLFMVDDELIKVTEWDNSGTSDKIDTCIRGFGNSVAAAHEDGAPVYQVVGVIGSGDAFTVNYIDIEEGSSTVQTRAVNSGGGGGGGGAPVQLAQFAGRNNVVGDDGNIDGSSIFGNDGAGDIQDDLDNAGTYTAFGFQTEQEAD